MRCRDLIFSPDSPTGQVPRKWEVASNAILRRQRKFYCLLLTPHEPSQTPGNLWATPRPNLLTMLLPSVAGTPSFNPVSTSGQLSLDKSPSWANVM